MAKRRDAMRDGGKGMPNGFETRSSIAMICCLAVGGLTVMADEPTNDDSSRRDVHSHGRPNRIRAEHLSLDLSIDFDKKQLRGSATLRIRRAPDCPPGSPLILDTRALAIESVSAGTDPKKLKPVRFKVGRPGPILGAPLKIAIGEDDSWVRIDYRTSPEATALQWVEPSQTFGGERPFLYTQSQAIHARSWIPLQDSPGVRLTYDATIRAPAGFTAVMSAESKGKTDDGAFRFEMNRPIPAYLIALAAGDLAFRPLGKRTGVYAEPKIIDKAANEFADAEAMIETVEKRYGPYRWGRYDILVPPPSFPFGGMENPRLTFATPTVLAGDRSLVSLVAHELAHSWSGNLVTNATWRDFWLNEGVTTYIELRIVEDLYGEDRAAMERVLGLRELERELRTFPPRDQILHVDLQGRDPDDGMTRVPYEKGALLLLALEEAFGRERFDAFLKDYFDRFAFSSMTTADFEAIVRERLFRQNPRAAARIPLRAWLTKPGLPASAPRPVSKRLNEVDRIRERWVERRISTADLAEKSGNWTTQEWLRFLLGLPESFPSARMADLDETFRFTDRENAEIAAAWLEMAIRAHYKPADARLERFLTTVGRRKYLMPLYAALAKSAAGKARAQAIFKKAKPHYHPIAADSVARLLQNE